MNLPLTNFHNRRFEWAFQAKNEFFNRFIEEDLEKIIGNDLSIDRLTKWFKEAEEAC